MRARLLCNLLVLVPAALYAQQRTTAEVRLDAARITVGSPARLTLEVHHRPLLGTLRWADFRDTFNKLELLQRGRIDTLSDGENTVYRQELVLTGFDSLLTAVPPLAFYVRPDAGEPYTVTTERLPLLVSTVPVDTTKPFRPIRDIVPAPGGGGLRDRWLLLLAGIALLGLFVFAVLYLRRSKVARAAPRPRRTALQQLEALAGEGLLAKGAVKEHYTRLADLVRDEVARRLRVATRERLTTEILEAVGTALPEAQTAALRRILVEADAVKFAKAVPAAEAGERTMADARQFLTQIAARP